MSTPTMGTRWRMARLAAAALVMAACAEYIAGPNGNTNGHVPSSIELSVAQLTLAEGDTGRIVATILDQQGQPISPVPTGVRIVWMTSDSTRVRVDAAGLLTALRTGTVTVSATMLTSTLSATVQSAVSVRGRVGRLELTVGSGQTGTVGTALTDSVRVRLLDAAGQPLPGLWVHFADRDSGAATSPDSVLTDTTGRVAAAWTLGDRAGSDTLRVDAGDSTGHASLVVTATARAGIAVRAHLTPDSATFATLGRTARLTAQYLDRFGNATAAPTPLPVWSAKTPAVATVDSTGTAKAVANGTGYVTLSGLASDSATIVVRQAAANVKVTLARTSVAQYDSTIATAAVTDSGGAAVAGVTPSWSTAPSSLASISTGGVIRALQPGTDTVRAAVTGGVAGYALLAITAPRVVHVVAVSGDNQTGTVADTLPSRLVVRAQDSTGTAVANVTVYFRTVAPNGGTVSADSLRTATDGTASVQWTMPTVAAVHPVLVARLGADSVIFHATTVAGAPKTLAVVSGSAQSGAVGTALTQPLVVRALDAYANAVSNVPVQWSRRGAGTLSATSTTTDSTGRTQVTYTLGSTAGTDTVTATVQNTTISASFVETATAPTTRVATLVVSPHADTLTSLGDAATLTAQSKDTAGTVIADTVTWTSRTTSIATVTSAGVVTAVANGTAWIVASDASGKRDSAQVLVRQRVASVTVTPTSRSIYLTKTYRFSASAVDGRGNPIAGSPVFTWTALATNVATVDSTGLVTATGIGSTEVHATTSGVTGVATVTVLSPIKRVVVGRDSAGMPVADTTSLTALGQTRTFIAVAYDTANAPMTGVTFTWTSTNASVASLDSITATTARATAGANGSTSIQASAGGITGSASLGVHQVLTGIQLSPASAQIAPRGMTVLSARGVDANGHTVANASFTFTSSATGIATVDGSGVVTGVAVGQANVTATSGLVTSNPSVITVSNSVPPKLSFARDTLVVGKGSGISIPVYLSTPDTIAVTVNLAIRDTLAYVSPASVTFAAGNTAANVTLVGTHPGTTEIVATDGSGTGYAADSAAVVVQATMKLASSSYNLNAGDQVSTQLQLSDPAPAGGSYVSFLYGTANVAALTPDPVFVPAGQLAANVVVKGLAAGGTSVTPTANGISGTMSSVSVAPADLSFAARRLVLGSGQYESGQYISAPATVYTPVNVTLTSSDTTLVSVPTSLTIAYGTYGVNFTASALGIGTAKVTGAAPGWTVTDTLTVISSTPHLAVSGGTSLTTTAPARNVTVYAEDSLGVSHRRINSLIVHLSSSDTTVMKVIDTVATIPAGQYYASAQVIPGGGGGQAYVRVTAGGHTSDSTLFTVTGPNLTWGRSNGHLGAGQYDPNIPVETQYSVTSPLTVTITSSDSTVAAVSSPVTIPAGSYYAYTNVNGLAPGQVKIRVSAPGYQSDSGTYTITTPALAIGGGGTYNNYGPPRGVTVYVEDSLGISHYRITALALSLHSTDTTVVKVDTSATVPAGGYYVNTPQVTLVGAGNAYVVVTAPGHRPDSTLFQVVTPRISFNNHHYILGEGQTSGTTALTVSTPDTRTSALAVTLTQKHATVNGLSATSLTIPSGGYLASFGATALALGTDTVIATAPGYNPDTMVVVVSTPQLSAGGIPGTAVTTSQPFVATVYMEDSVGVSHYVADSVTLEVTPSDSTVIKPRQRWLRVPAGQYYGNVTVDIVGPGSSFITFSDSAGVYKPSGTNPITVTGPQLSLSGNITLGMRQMLRSTDYNVSVPNSVTTPLVVHLAVTNTRVASVPDSVIIPAGSYLVSFGVTALDTIGTVQLQASATGYSPTSSTIQVTQPKFFLSTPATVNTTSPPQSITVYATDANGTSHYTTEPVTVTLTSSVPGVAAIDSTTVTIPANAYYNSQAHWSPGTVGSAQITASDSRAAFYAYTPSSANVNVITPSLSFTWGTQTLGVGQYNNVGVSTADNMKSAVEVQLAHTGAARTTTIPADSVAVAAGSSIAYFRIVGSSLGTDTLVASLASPLHNPATGFTVVGQGRVDAIANWPTSIVAGDSVQVTMYAHDQAGYTHNVLNATTFTLAPNANISFVSGGASSATLTSVTIPAGGQYVSFWLKAVSAGTGSVTISNTDYQTYTPTVTVNP